MHLIYHGMQLNYKEIINAKDKIYCVFEKGINASKTRYCMREKQDNKDILKSIISDEAYDISDINNKSIIVYQVKDNHKLRYINNNISIDEDEIENLDDLFLNTYKEYE